MYKKYIPKIVISLLLLIIVSLVTYYNFYYSYEIVDEEDWRTDFYKSHCKIDVEIDLALTEKDAVKIADKFFRNCTNRRYEVYYYAEKNCYYVGARYVKKRYNIFNYSSESVAMILINKSTGEIADLKIIVP